MKKVSIKVGHWFHCACGKFHPANMVETNTLCKCGLELYPQILNKSNIEHKDEK
jgi:hypothetical protein